MNEEEKIMLETNRSITNMETCFRNKIQQLQQENKELHNKLEKAIEYIEHFSKNSEVKIYGIPETKVFIGDIEQLLEILKGDVGD